ncbi:hypothetical protein [Seohaeicola zhoushanensis]|uniref:Uncharacterized protein n=1 Tax=Seohaeicola zhoushanensis TaxID=1569283 RepID=A0A8J3M5K5_9RHOB|nr:hypothetical protein [Seohaeicola zhoushanensis]GHF36862.1 hypothetical protein GCM10017056_05930 [Seohaeicola zhoushanensis]
MTEIESIIRNEVGSTIIQTVKIQPAVNRDGENVLFIDVIYDENGTLPNGVAVTVTDLIWNHLQSEANDAFPVINFISSSDAMEHHAA